MGEKDACFDEEQDDAVDDELKDKVCGELQVPSIPDDNINLLLACRNLLLVQPTPISQEDQMQEKPHTPPTQDNQLREE